MLALVRRARRRLFRNELFAQGANASSAALLAFILLLVAGAEILKWEIVVAIPAITLAAGVWIARRRLASEYRTAQILDRRMGLADTLSTALYYRESGAKGSPEVIRLQAEEAERAAKTVDLGRALPYTMPRAAYAVAALFVVAGSLFALRYGVMRQLDLKQPLATILHDTFGRGKAKTEQAKAKLPKVPRPELAPDQEFTLSQDQMSRDPQDGNQADEGEIPGKAEAIQAEAGSKQSKDGSAQTQGDDQSESTADRDANDGQNPKSGQQGNQDGKPGKQDPNNSGDSNSLMSKVKDAVQNLLSRMKPQQQGGQQSGEQKGQQSKGQQNGGKQQSAKNSQQQGGEQSEGQDGQSGEQAENAQQQQGKSQGNSDSKQASKQPGSGVGSQDGDKSVKQAEQLAAMGKISEILGKRAQTLTGETTVEVQSTSQQLRTQYMRGTSQHTQGGTEINRDEVPVALESYVENYFEQVRKTGPAAAAGQKK